MFTRRIQNMLKIIILLFCTVFTVQCKLKFLMTLHRHGARTPNNLYKPGYWPEGQAQLTEYGKSQLFELGKEYRRRYVLNESEEVKDFFPNEFNFETINDILALTSPKDRAYESFLYLYKGLFDNSSIEPKLVNITNDSDIFKGQAEEKKLNLHVYIPPLDADFYLHAFDSDVCPLSGLLQSRTKNTPRYQTELNKYRKSLFPTLAEETNKKWGTNFSSDTMTFAEMSSVLDLIYSAKAHNISRDVPEFSDDVVALLNKAKQFYIYEGKFGDSLLPRLTVTKVFGLLKNILIDQFNGISRNPKWLELSAHDTDIAGFFKAILTEDELWSLPDNNLDIPYASHLEIEVHQEERGDPFVKLFSNGLEIQMRRCGSPCTINRFLRILNETSVQGDLRTICNNSNFNLDVYYVLTSKYRVSSFPNFAAAKAYYEVHPDSSTLATSGEIILSKNSSADQEKAYADYLIDSGFMLRSIQTYYVYNLSSHKEFSSLAASKSYLDSIQLGILSDKEDVIVTKLGNFSESEAVKTLGRFYDYSVKNKIFNRRLRASPIAVFWHGTNECNICNLKEFDDYNKAQIFFDSLVDWPKAIIEEGTVKNITNHESGWDYFCVGQYFENMTISKANYFVSDSKFLVKKFKNLLSAKFYYDYVNGSASLATRAELFFSKNPDTDERLMAIGVLVDQNILIPKFQMNQFSIIMNDGGKDCNIFDYQDFKTAENQYVNMSNQFSKVLFNNRKIQNESAIKSKYLYYCLGIFALRPSKFIGSVARNISHEILESLKDQASRIAKTLPKESQKLVKYLQAQGSFNADSFHISQTMGILQGKLNLPQQAIEKFKKIIYAGSLNFESFGISIQVDKASTKEFVGTALKKGDIVSIAYIMVISYAELQPIYETIRKKKCNTVFFFFQNCVEEVETYTRGYNTAELLIITDALRAKSFEFLDQELQRPPQDVISFSSLQKEMIDYNEMNYPSVFLKFKGEVQANSTEKNGKRLITDLVKNVLSKFPAMKMEIESRKTSVVDKLVNRGFTTFSQETSVEEYNGVEQKYIDPFLDELEVELFLPPEYSAQFKSAMKVILFADSSDWLGFNIAFSVGKGSECKYVCILARNNKEDNTVDWLVANIKATFEIAPNIIIVEEKCSVLGGLWSSTQERVAIMPASITFAQLKTVFEFFEIVAFKRFAEMLRIETPYLISLPSQFLSKNLLRGGANSDGLDMAKKGIEAFASNWSKAIQEIKLSNNTQVREVLLRKGLSYFAQSAQAQKVIGLQEGYYPKYKLRLIDRLNVPADKRPYLEEFLNDFLSNDDQTWTAFQFMYSSEGEVLCKFVSLLAHYDSSTKRIDLLLSDVRGQFELAKDVMVVSESTSKAGGNFTESNIKLKEIPKNISGEDLNSIMSFFNIVSFKNFADLLGIEADLPVLEVYE